MVGGRWRVWRGRMMWGVPRLLVGVEGWVMGVFVGVA